jgi:uncharacterized RDD family membrane protein YckC
LNPYAAPDQRTISPTRDAAEPAAVVADPRRVHAGWRAAAATISFVPVFAVQVAVVGGHWGGTLGDVLALFGFAFVVILDVGVALPWALFQAALETAFGGSLGMIVLGLRVAREDGARPSLGRRAAKAALVRLPSIVGAPWIAAGTRVMIDQVHAGFRGPRRHYPGWTSIERVVFGVSAVLTLIVTITWIVGYLGAFGRRRQTIVDRLLGTVVVRARDVRAVAAATLLAE